MAKPVLENMSLGQLKKQMLLQLSPIWDGRNPEVAYLEAFGRLMAGIAPWLDLPDDDTEEGKLRKQVYEWSIQCCKNAVNPQNPDYLQWEGAMQIIVDAAYLANAFLRAPEKLWEPLDSLTKERYIQKFKNLRTFRIPYNNWLLFRAMIETFLFLIEDDCDLYAIDMAVRKCNEWYLRDGWYGDGQEFSMDLLQFIRNSSYVG